ncbi:MAG TPA: hypothetical protein VHE13_01775 [Opitutus sp.]|nr:hypothetical protein [Opitutus sp.]
MNHETKPAPVHPLVAVVLCCATASVGIAALAVCLLRDLSDSRMWAVAAMVAAPSVMGIAIADFMTKRPQPEGTPAESQG